MCLRVSASASGQPPGSFLPVVKKQAGNGCRDGSVVNNSDWSSRRPKVLLPSKHMATQNHSVTLVLRNSAPAGARHSCDAETHMRQNIHTCTKNKIKFQDSDLALLLG